jgi:hypothetical protein
MWTSFLPAHSRPVGRGRAMIIIYCDAADALLIAICNGVHHCASADPTRPRCNLVVLRSQRCLIEQETSRMACLANLGESETHKAVVVCR